MKKLRDMNDFLKRKVEQLERKGNFMKDSNGEFQKLKEEYLNQKMSEEQVQRLQAEIGRARMEAMRRRKRKFIQNFSVTAAAMVLSFIVLPNTSAGMAHAMERIPLLGKLVEVVTFRDYQYEDGRNTARIEVPELVPGEADAGETPAPEAVEANIKKSTEEINAEIRQITDNIVSEFEKNLKNTEGYQYIEVEPEVLCTTDDYFTLKLCVYQASGSGTQWNFFYTIDLTTGKRIFLPDIFKEGADYITPVSEDIKAQMRAQMKADENKIYWVDYTEVPEWDFMGITEKSSFYLNREGKLVIAFDEGDVAPSYMGTVEFVISDEAVEGLLKTER